ncbi:MAG: TlpA disulfide reductase family protein [Nannocystaceae bacterium]
MAEKLSGQMGSGQGAPRRRSAWSWCAAASLWAGAACGIAPERPTAGHASATPELSEAGAELLGRALPELEVDGWLQLDSDGEVITPTPAPTLASLRGHVVVVRFWTDTCPYCRASMPGFVALAQRFRDDGVVVIGIHHPKPAIAADAVVDRTRVAETARAWAMDFPIALDEHWLTLRRWWLTRPRDATSATLVLDRDGIVRWVHPGPELHPDGPRDHVQCRRDYDALVRAVQALL